MVVEFWSRLRVAIEYFIMLSSHSLALLLQALILSEAMSSPRVYVKGTLCSAKLRRLSRAPRRCILKNVCHELQWSRLSEALG